ncbi:MAG TPA: toll/interleukin-1 receptor domain-containing protein [Thermoanaerobaculia bacterium]|jgi:hypothetical protein|nr:toll/interleukin-1 receptor domain-containing protein [Thermoanaerobaculia bacterium]
MATSSTLRIYLAAVPGQMDGERAVLEGLVLPELRARAEELGVAVELVDPMKAKGEDWDLAQRFGEIDRCRPFFLALLGERYGDPPRAVSLDLVAAYPWLAEDPGRSVLELEILHAALRDPGNAAGSFLYFRDPRFPAIVPDQHRSRFLPETERAAARLSGLKDRIRASGLPVFDGYPCGWSDSLERASRLDALAEQMLEDLWPAIREYVRTEASAAVDAVPSSAAPPIIPEPPPWEPPAAHLPPEEPLPVHENVQFTVYRSRSVEPLKWYPLLAFAHLSELPEDAPADEPDPLQEVQDQARRVLGGLAKGYADVKQDSRYAVPHEAELTFLPEIPGFHISPPRRTFLWLESVQREEFRIRATPELDGTLVRGRMSVFWGSILLAEINLGIRVDSRLAGAAAQPPAERSASRPFRNIFPSYSHRDAGIVEEFERFARTLGDRYLRDVHELRAGEAWNDRLKELIQKADVFQLFWSRNAMQSPYVEEEWRYALSLGRPHFVRPTYWEDPLPEDPDRDLPPGDLRRLHFQLLSTGEAQRPSAHGRFGELAEPAPVPSASPSRSFDPNATAIAPAADDFRLFEDREPSPEPPGQLASFREPTSPDDDVTLLDDTAVGAAPELDDSWTGIGAAEPPTPPPPMERTVVSAPVPPPPVSAPSVGRSYSQPTLPPRSARRGAGLKIAAVLAMAVLGLSIFALRARFGAQGPDQPIDISSPNQTVTPPNSTPLPTGDHEIYDPATWKELTAACELSGEEISSLPSRQEPGANMIEVFASPSAYNARVVKQQLDSVGAFILPRREEGKAVCAVVLDPWEPKVQDYLKQLRARGTEPRDVLFPEIPGS